VICKLIFQADSNKRKILKKLIMSKSIYLLIGAPGSGKTSSMEKVNNDCISHFSIGAMYRKISEEETSFGKIVKSYIDEGKVVPIDIARNVIQNFIESRNDIIVIDAFPRDMEQTKMFETLLGEKVILKQVIEILINPEKALKRIVNRNRGVDDDVKLFNDRMNVYNKEIQLIREYYKSKGIYMAINGENSVEDTAKKLASIILD
jgi:adenylate kinase